MKNVKVYVMYAGRINLPDKGHMTPGKDVGQPISMPVYTYLIVHPEGLVLVDTGQQQGGPSVVNEEDKIVNRLKQIGYTTEDIRYVIMTHLHVDHAAYMDQFPNATFIVRKEELRAAWWSERSERGYVYEHYKNTREFTFFEPLDEEVFDVFMDGTVRCIDTKGHTRGHQSVIVELEKTGRLVIVGDAASFAENVGEEIPPGACSNTWYAMQSMQKLRHLRECGCLLLYGHDVEQEKSILLSPLYYK